MEQILQLIRIQEEKGVFLEDYLKLNAMLLQAAETGNTRDLQDLNQKKKRLVEAVELLDRRLLDKLEALKQELKVDDLSETSAQTYPELRTLKILSGEVLKVMVEVKQSDDTVTTAIDKMYKGLKGSQKPQDMNRLAVYTQNYFR